MVEDAQAEAERIVDYYVRKIERGSTGSTRKAYKDELVAALADALEVAERVHMAPTMRGHIPDKGSTRKLLAAQVDALAALLRKTDREATG